MPLLSIIGGRAEANMQLMRIACRNTPSLVIDCANFANPHMLMKHEDPDVFDRVYVIETEVLYRFRDALKKVPLLASRLGIKTVVVTAFHELFDYDDEIENVNIYKACWEMMSKYSEELGLAIYVGVLEGTPNFEFAKMISECIEADNMGHTAWSQRITLDVLIGELNDYAYALDEHDRKAFEEILKVPMRKISAISYASSVHAWAFMLLAIIIEQENRMRRLESECVANRLLQER